MAVKFKPDPKMKTLYMIYLFSFVLLGILSWALPLTLLFLGDSLAMTIMAVFVYAPTIFIVAFTAYWVNKYYETVEYVVEDDRIVARGGVWWKRESSIPFFKINNVVFRQGPLQRTLGLATLGFHTAAMGTYRPEVLFSNLSVEDAQKVREMVTEKVVVLGAEKSIAQQMLEELRAIRKLLERK